MKKIKDNIILRSFIAPMVVGFAIGIICYKLNFEFPVRALYTISENFIALLLFIAPFMVLIYTISGVNQIRDAKKFFIKFISLVFVTLTILALITSLIAHLIVPHILLDMNPTKDAFIDPYFVLPLKPFFTTITALYMGIMFGLFIPKDSISMKVVAEGEVWIENFAKGFLLPIMPIWIVGVFAQSAFASSASSLFINDLILSTLILSLQFIWLGIMYFIVSIITKKSFKKIVSAGLKLYVKVTSIMGLGTGIIIPFAIDAQKEIDVDPAVAKLVSVSSLNMPGSVISNIIFAYGVIVMYGIDVTPIAFMMYAVALIFATMIAPAIPGGVFSVTSSLLSPMLGFTPEQISMMGALYYKQGTSNSSTNNAADVYLGGLLDSNAKV